MRTNFYYDPQRQGYDTNLWKTITGTPAIASNKLVFNADAAIQYGDCFRGVYNFAITIPGTPTNGFLTAGTGCTTQLYGILTGGTGATSAFATWASVTDAGFKATIDGTLRAVGPINFTGAGSMAAVATMIQTAVRTATGATETVVWSTNKFIITASKSCSVLTSPDSGTDISGAGATAFMDSDSGGTAVAATTGWRNVADGEFTVTVDNVAYDITGINFITATDLDEVAALIQAKLRATITTNTWITCAYDTDHFVITSRENVSLLTAVSGGSGTDISGIAAGNQYLDGDAAGTSAAATSGSEKEWGLIALNKGMKATFKIAGASLQMITKDEDGVIQLSYVDYDTDWNATEMIFGIDWAGQCVKFNVNYETLAWHETANPSNPMSLYVKNADADNLIVGYIEGLGLESYV